MQNYQFLKEAQQAGIAPWTDVVHEDSHVVIYKDKYPVTKGHLLFVPQYNTDDCIDMAFQAALKCGRQDVESGKYNGFNIGINCGETAGQTVMYPHVHLIPRRIGDCTDPTGGVRGVIFGQANYKAPGYQEPK